jgi:DNA-binding transcriptional MocR family regulator
VTEKTWPKQRVEMLGKLTRIVDLSDGAYKLWVELAFNWAWGKPECCPKLKVVAVALGAHKNTVTRWLDELQRFGLVTGKTRIFRGWTIHLATEVPQTLLQEAWRFNNAKLTQRVKKQGKSPPMVTSKSPLVGTSKSPPMVTA